VGDFIALDAAREEEEKEIKEKRKSRRRKKKRRRSHEEEEEEEEEVILPLKDHEEEEEEEEEVDYEKVKMRDGTYKRRHLADLYHYGLKIQSRRVKLVDKLTYPQFPDLVKGSLVRKVCWLMRWLIFSSFL